MITLTVLLMLIFVPTARRVVGRMVSGVFAALGIVFLASRDSSNTRQT